MYVIKTKQAKLQIYIPSHWFKIREMRLYSQVIMTLRHSRRRYEYLHPYSFACVYPFVFLQSIPLNELRITLLTRMWFFSCMNSFMLLQTLCLSKLSITIVARIWFFTCVNSFMTIQRALC